MKGAPTQTQKIHSIQPSQYQIRSDAINYPKDYALKEDISKQSYKLVNPNSQQQQRVPATFQQEQVNSYRTNQRLVNDTNSSNYVSQLQQQPHQMNSGDKQKIFCQSPTLGYQQAQNNRNMRDGRTSHQSTDIRRVPTNEYLQNKQTVIDAKMSEKGVQHGINAANLNHNQQEQRFQQKFEVSNSIQQKFKAFEVHDNMNERSDRHEINETRQIQNKIENLNSIQDKFKIQLSYKSATQTNTSPLEGFRMSPKNNQTVGYSNQKASKDQEKKQEFMNAELLNHFVHKNQKVDSNNILKDSKQVNYFNKEQQQQQHQPKIIAGPQNQFKSNLQQQQYQQLPLQQQQLLQQQNQIKQQKEGNQNAPFNSFNDQQNQVLQQHPYSLKQQQNYNTFTAKLPIDQNNQLLINNPSLNVNDFKMNHMMFKNSPFPTGEVKLVKNINDQTPTNAATQNASSPKENKNNTSNIQTNFNAIDFKISSASVLQPMESNDASTAKQSIINKIDMGKPIHKATKSIFNTSSTTAALHFGNSQNERRSFHNNSNYETNYQSSQGFQDKSAQNNSGSNNLLHNYNSNNNYNNIPLSSNTIKTPQNNFPKNLNQKPPVGQQNLISQQQQAHNSQNNPNNSSMQSLQKNPSVSHNLSLQQAEMQSQPNSSKQQPQQNSINKYSSQNSSTQLNETKSLTKQQAEIPALPQQQQDNSTSLQKQQQEKHQNEQNNQKIQQNNNNNNNNNLNKNNIQLATPNYLSSNNISLNQQNFIKTPSSNQINFQLNPSAAENNKGTVENRLKQLGSAEKPQLHINSQNKIAPKNIGDQQGGGPNSHKYNIDLKQVKNTNEKPHSAHLKFPQPAHFDRDSFKSKRSSVQSQTGRSDMGSINNEIIKTQNNNNNNSNNNYDSLNYEKISQQNDKSTFIDSIKVMSDNFFTKTQQFFQNNFKKINSRLGCTCDLNLKADATCSKAYSWLLKEYKKEDLNGLKATYESVKNHHLPEMEQYMIQIEKDLGRTFPSLEMSQNEKYINSLRNLLQAVAKYDPQIGYVQGMNMIGASLLYHAEEYISFWIMQIIFEKLEMREIYKPQLPGLSKHIQLIDIITLTRLPDLYSHFCQNFITFDMFCSPWIFSLFGIVLTPEKLTILFTELLEEGWLMFYKLVIAFLCYHKEFLFQQDMGEMLVTLTQDNYKFESQEQWELLIKYSKNVNIDSQFINSMLESYDPEKKQFIMKHR